MDDLLLTQTDHARTRWARAPPGMFVPVAVLCLPAVLAGQWLVVLWIFSGCAALVALLRQLVRCGWMRVDAAGQCW